MTATLLASVTGPSRKWCGGRNSVTRFSCRSLRVQASRSSHLALWERSRVIERVREFAAVEGARRLHCPNHGRARIPSVKWRFGAERQREEFHEAVKLAPRAASIARAF
jgi:hypothetical protein